MIKLNLLIRVYMHNKRRFNSSIINLRLFHNWIKHNLYSKTSTLLREKYKQKEINILELAVGKGGDLFKWIGINANEVVGVDIDKESVFGKNGAKHRYLKKLKSKKLGEHIPRCDFYVDDLRKPDSFKNMEKKYGNRQFNIISCQFAIHYFFESEIALNNITKIIGKFLKPNGYFIGTTMNPDEINSLFVHGEVVKKDSFSIELKTDLKDSYKPYNNKYVVSLGKKDEDHYFGQKPSIEFLVDKTELETKLKKYNIELIEYEVFKEHYNNYLKTNPKNKMSDAEKEFSFLNISFVFQRTGQ